MLLDSMDPRIAAAVGEAFDLASEKARVKGNMSVERESVGERGRREDSFTEDLLDEFETTVRQTVGNVQDELGGTGIKLGVSFEAVNLPTGEETEYGADFGIRFKMRTTAGSIDKAILVQAKRMRLGRSGNADFPALRTDGAEQAKKMLRVTPASFFLLYNYGDPADLVSLVFPPSGGRILAYIPGGSGGFRPSLNCGMTMLPATQVSAVANALPPRTGFPAKAVDVLPGSLPMGYFMSQLFATCFVGDVRTSILRVVTPPRLRDRLFPADDDETHLDRILVRRSVVLDLDTRGGEFLDNG